MRVAWVFDSFQLLAATNLNMFEQLVDPVLTGASQQGSVAA